MKKILQISAAYLICALFTCLMINSIIMPSIPKDFDVTHKSSYDFSIKLDHRGSMENRHSGNLRTL